MTDWSCPEKNRQSSYILMSAIGRKQPLGFRISMLFERLLLVKADIQNDSQCHLAGSYKKSKILPF